MAPYILLAAFLVGYAVISFLLKNRTKKGEEDQTNKYKKENNDFSWYEILQITENSNLDQIKVAYRQQIAKYHPDRVAHLGKELRDLAEEKTKEINYAYGIALKIKKK